MARITARNEVDKHLTGWLRQRRRWLNRDGLMRKGRRYRLRCCRFPWHRIPPGLDRGQCKFESVRLQNSFDNWRHLQLFSNGRWVKRPFSEADARQAHELRFGQQAARYGPTRPDLHRLIAPAAKNTLGHPT
jgi:hypothetical protein